ncbi:MAG: hypothetical protein F6J87_21090 [Spirulina sp. SIO3F2]|nr:hypothetical protein [Spirulina sp. SIO3F2]
MVRSERSPKFYPSIQTTAGQPPKSQQLFNKYSAIPLSWLRFGMGCSWAILSLDGYL